MRLSFVAQSPRLQFIAGALLLVAAWVASILHSANSSPQIPGYHSVNVTALRDPWDAKALDGRRVWITGGVGWGFDGDALVPPFNGDHPDQGPYVKLNLSPGSIVRLPQTRNPFQPYGVFHATRAEDHDDRLQLSLSVDGESPSVSDVRSTSIAAIALFVAAAGALTSSLLLTARRAYSRQHADRFTPGCCPICSYDLRATPRRCPECGAAC